MKTIFIVPSCINSKIGALDFETRYKLSFDTFNTIRKQVENATIIFCDSSIGGLSEEKKKELTSNVDYYLDYSEDPIAQKFNDQGLKSFGEVYLLRNGIEFAKMKLDLEEPGRMFKLGARYYLLDSFTMSDYKNTENKYVFKKKVESWMDKNISDKYNSAYMLQTLLYSWSFSLTDEYLQILDNITDTMMMGFDTEHAHFLNIPKEKLLEYDNLNAAGNVAGYTNAYYVEH
jgi:hypothetical protein